VVPITQVFGARREPWLPPVLEGTDHRRHDGEFLGRMRRGPVGQPLPFTSLPLSTADPRGLHETPDEGLLVLDGAV
jgi:hypothetical protein